MKSQHVKAYFWYELNDNNVANNLYDYNTTSFGLYDFYSNPKPALSKYFSLISQTATPEFSFWIILLLVSVLILVSIVFARKKMTAPSKRGKILNPPYRKETNRGGKG